MTFEEAKLYLSKSKRTNTIKYREAVKVAKEACDICAYYNGCVIRSITFKNAREQFMARLTLIMEYEFITASELAEKSGINKSSISRYVNGKSTPKQNNLYKLAKALHVNQDDLLIL